MATPQPRREAATTQPSPGGAFQRRAVVTVPSIVMEHCCPSGSIDVIEEISRIIHLRTCPSGTSADRSSARCSNAQFAKSAYSTPRSKRGENEKMEIQGSDLVRAPRVSPMPVTSPLSPPQRVTWEVSGASGGFAVKHGKACRRVSLQYHENLLPRE